MLDDAIFDTMTLVRTGGDQWVVEIDGLTFSNPAGLESSADLLRMAVNGAKFGDLTWHGLTVDDVEAVAAKFATHEELVAAFGS